MKRFLVIIMTLLCLAFPSSAAGFDVYETRVKEEINAVRVERDLVPLRFNECADRRAEKWAWHLKWKEEDLKHQNMQKVLRVCDAWMSGEIIAAGDIDPKTAVKLWLESPEHKKVIINPGYRQIGVGVKEEDGRKYVVVNFLLD